MKCRHCGSKSHQIEFCPDVLRAFSPLEVQWHGTYDPTICRWSGCVRGTSYEGFCERHAQYAIKKGLAQDPGRCRISGCSRFAMGTQGRCKSHSKT